MKSTLNIGRIGTSYTLFTKEYYERLSNLPKDQRKDEKPSVSKAWAELSLQEKEEYKKRAKILRTDQSSVSNTKKLSEQDENQPNIARIKLGPVKLMDKTKKRKGIPKQKSLYIYDPKTVYAHELYTFKTTKNKKSLPVRETKEANPVSSIILDYSQRKKSLRYVAQSSYRDTPLKPLPRDDSILISYAKDIKPGKKEKFVKDVKIMLSNLQNFEESSVGKTIATNYTSQLVVLCQKLRLPFAKYSYEKVIHDDGTFSFLGLANLKSDDLQTIAVKSSNGFKNKKTARQCAAYLALIEFSKLKQFTG